MAASTEYTEFTPTSTLFTTTVSETSSDIAMVDDMMIKCAKDRNILQKIGHIFRKRGRDDATLSTSLSAPRSKRIKLNEMCLAGGGDYGTRGFPETNEDFRVNRHNRVQSWIEDEKKNKGIYEQNPRQTYNASCMFCNPKRREE